MLSIDYKVYECHVHFLFTLHGRRVFRLRAIALDMIGGHEGWHMSRSIKIKIKNEMNKATLKDKGILLFHQK